MSYSIWTFWDPECSIDCEVGFLSDCLPNRCHCQVAVFLFLQQCVLEMEAVSLWHIEQINSCIGTDMKIQPVFAFLCRCLYDSISAPAQPGRHQLPFKKGKRTRTPVTETTKFYAFSAVFIISQSKVFFVLNSKYTKFSFFKLLWVPSIFEDANF